MKSISIALPGPRVLGKMRRGHSVRIAQGEGVKVIVHPHKYNHVTRSFAKNKGATLQLSGEELAANSRMGGEGIFGQFGDRALKAIGNKLGVGGDRLKDAAYKVGDYLKPKVKEAISRGGDQLKTRFKNYKNLAEPAVDFAVGKAHRFLDKPHEFGVGGTGLLDDINHYTGQTLGNLRDSTMGNALANASLAQLQAAVVNARHRGFGGRGLGAGLMVPKNNVRARRREVGSIGIAGNLLSGPYLPPALVSQPYSVNYQFAKTLPPAYQKFNNSI